MVRIIEDNKRNYDLVYNTSKDQFNVIAGDSLCGINFSVSRESLYNRWNNITISFNGDAGELTIISNGKRYTQKKIHPAKGSCYKLLFGANQFEPFATTDTPPMKVRNVKIFKKGRLEYHWPLDEVEGTVAVDLVKNAKAMVHNPSWQTALHSKWQKGKSITVNGIASVAFDEKNEAVYVVAEDTVYSYAVKNATWLMKNTNDKINLNQGNRSFFNPADQRLYNYILGKETPAIHGFENGNWQGNFPLGEVTGYWHANKMFSSVDSSLYLFGGYGYLVYRNSVQRYNFNSHKWSNLKYKGDFFTPRYLAGLGATEKGDTAYILGGYGNSSGQQILNPRNLYDMMRFTVKDKTFTRLFELKINREDFALANSLILDSKKKIYYGLIYPRHKYNSSLQLIRGSLQDPSFQLLGSVIPYAFHDVHSFADLFYCKNSNKFVAVTLLRTDNNKSVVNVYTLLGPPYIAPVKTIPEHNNKVRYALYTVACIVLFCLFFIFFKGYRRRKLKIETAESEYNHANHEPVSEQFNEMELAEHLEVQTAKVPAFKNTILLFGDLQVFDATGNSITKQFTPLIRELFLLILLHSVKLGRGVSSDKLNEMFWFDKSEKSARNNRSVAIVKLKSLLEKLDFCTLSKDSGYWMMEIDYQHFYIDYHSYLNIINNRKKLDDDAIKHLSSIVQRGSFLSTSEYEWLDNFKSEISGNIIDTYLHYLHKPEHHNDPESLIRIANYILNIDPVNEEAMTLKCQSFVALGKHSLAKGTFENFEKAYKHMYDKSFGKNFSAILENAYNLKG
ncbi:kelch repeat-containing protein [Mucilaginibacter gynuensis]|uniref:kelch repeat-containing protein n=1 Tax=Mucilaginibacter gynuensis TaxID=1302236 RepID=UPI0031E6B99E